MAIVNREFTYRRQIKVSRSDLAAAEEGRKTCTIRLGVAHVDEPTINLTDGANSLRVKIASVSTERFRDLSEGHARCEGFRTVEELWADLRTYYPQIDADQPVTIIRFERFTDR